MDAASLASYASRIMKHRLFPAVAALLAFGAAHAAPCPRDAPLPSGFERWAHPGLGVAAWQESGTYQATLPLGRAMTLHLPDIGTVHFIVPPGGKGSHGPYGGMIGIDVPSGATYRVMLSGRAWIDMVQDRADLPSSAHQHGPDCTGIAKIVSFPLHAGWHVLQISGAPDPTITVMMSATP
ncbi:hypothetical protein [Acidomonas methanolica]|uniref:hypothetical protein n=1 Tax=Acidomonas methanolica TaxID=437 RepID=UPI002119FFFB|nr:hypothetical protein [Acidomonas methanolica]MCQ9155264.1 hypothetical protein [Acidomonas methanolica]